MFTAMVVKAIGNLPLFGQGFLRS